MRTRYHDTSLNLYCCSTIHRMGPLSEFPPSRPDASGSRGDVSPHSTRAPALSRQAAAKILAGMPCGPWSGWVEIPADRLSVRTDAAPCTGTRLARSLAPGLAPRWGEIRTRILVHIPGH